VELMMYYQKGFAETFAQIPYCEEVLEAFDNVNDEFKRLIAIEENKRRRIHQQL
jgi:hypothetical protein